MDIDYAIEKLNKRAAEYRLNELLLISASRFKKQPNLDSLYEAESLEQVAKWLKELKEARGKLKTIEDIAREAFNKIEYIHQVTDLSYGEARRLYMENGEDVIKAIEDIYQVTIEEVNEDE